MARKDAKSNAAPLCVYIAARGHSGSTMLELLLNRYPGIAAVGEVDQLPLQIIRDGVETKWEGLCSCSKRPVDCEIWGSVLDSLSSRLARDIKDKPFDFPISDVGLAQEYGSRRPLAYIQYLFHRTIRSLAHRCRIKLPGIFPYRNWIRNRDHIYRALAQLHGAAAIVDASKDAMQMSDLVQYSDLPVKVLFLTRDVRGNAWSSIRRKDASASDEARDWASVNRLILSRLDRLPKTSWLQVKYEDLCADTDAELQRILDFLGIDSQAVSPEDEQAERHTIAGNQVRFASLDAIRQDLAWKEKLTQEHIVDIRRVAGQTARRLDYEI